MLDRIWIWFAENGNIRKWQREPFPEGTEFVALSTVTPAEVGGLVGRLQERATVMEALSPDFASACRESASLIQSQAARIAELEAGLAEALRLLGRYRTETPLGNQPHMIALEAETFAASARTLLTKDRQP